MQYSTTSSLSHATGPIPTLPPIINNLFYRAIHPLVLKLLACGEGVWKIFWVPETKFLKTLDLCRLPLFELPATHWLLLLLKDTPWKTCFPTSSWPSEFVSMIQMKHDNLLWFYLTPFSLLKFWPVAFCLVTNCYCICWVLPNKAWHFAVHLGMWFVMLP